MKHIASCTLAAALMASAAWAQTPGAATTAPATTTTAPQGQTLNAIAAIVNDQMISVADVDQRALLLLIGRNLEATTENIAQARPVALEELIEERLQLQKAAEFELEVEQAAILDGVRDIASQSNVTVETLYDTLRQAGVNPAALEEQMRAQIAWRRIMGGLYGQRIRISQVQIDNMLNRMELQAKKPRYNLQEIFVFAPTPEDRAQLLPNMQTLVQQIRSGAPFGLVAQRFSQAPTAAAGGDMGWVSPDELDPAVQAVLAEAQPPVLTAPIESDDGIFIYAFLGRQEPAATDSNDLALKQLLLLPSGEETELLAARDAVESCAGVEAAADVSPNVVAADLGKVNDQALTPAVRAVVSGVAEGEASDVFDTAAGKSVVFVCERSVGGLQMPPRDDVEDRLYSQQISMLSDRELRDLKRDATIIRR